MEIRPWRIYILISSCTSALAFLAITWLPESPKFLLAMGRKEEALAILRRIYAANGLGTEEVSVHVFMDRSFCRETVRIGTRIQFGCGLYIGTIHCR